MLRIEGQCDKSVEQNRKNRKNNVLFGIKSNQSNSFANILGLSNDNNGVVNIGSANQLDSRQSETIRRSERQTIIIGVIRILYRKSINNSVVFNHLYFNLHLAPNLSDYLSVRQIPIDSDRILLHIV